MPPIENGPGIKIHIEIFLCMGVKKLGRKKMANKSLFKSQYRVLVKVLTIKLIFLFLIQNTCCGYSKEPSQ